MGNPPIVTAENIEDLKRLTDGGLYLDRSGDTYVSGLVRSDYLLASAREWDSEHGDLDLTLDSEGLARQLTDAIAASWDDPVVAAEREDHFPKSRDEALSALRARFGADVDWEAVASTVVEVWQDEPVHLLSEYDGGWVVMCDDTTLAAAIAQHRHMIVGRQFIDPAGGASRFTIIGDSGSSATVRSDNDSSIWEIAYVLHEEDNSISVPADWESDPKTPDESDPSWWAPATPFVD